MIQYKIVEEKCESCGFGGKTNPVHSYTFDYDPSCMDGPWKKGKALLCEQCVAATPKKIKNILDRIK